MAFDTKIVFNPRTMKAFILSVLITFFAETIQFNSPYSIHIPKILVEGDRIAIRGRIKENADR